MIYLIIGYLLGKNSTPRQPGAPAESAFKTRQEWDNFLYGMGVLIMMPVIVTAIAVIWDYFSH